MSGSAIGTALWTGISSVGIGLFVVICLAVGLLVVVWLIDPIEASLEVALAQERESERESLAGEVEPARALYTQQEVEQTQRRAVATYKAQGKVALLERPRPHDWRGWAVVSGQIVELHQLRVYPLVIVPLSAQN